MSERVERAHAPVIARVRSELCQRCEFGDGHVLIVEQVGESHVRRDLDLIMIERGACWRGHIPPIEARGVIGDEGVRGGGE